MPGLSFLLEQFGSVFFQFTFISIKVVDWGIKKECLLIVKEVSTLLLRIFFYYDFLL